MKKKMVLLALAMLVVPFGINAKEITTDTTLTENVTDGILVKSGSDVTLNLAGYDVTNNSGDTIKIEKGAKLTITGKGNVTNELDDYAVIHNLGTLTVKNGTYSRVETVKVTYYVVLNHGVMTIDGGTFKISSPDVGNSASSLIDNGWYHPEQNTDKAMSELTINDGEFLIENNNKYIKNDDYGIMTINGGTFTMVEPCTAVIGTVGNYSGKELLTVNNGTFNYTGTKYAIWNKVGDAVINGGTYNLTDANAKVSNIEVSTGKKEYPVLYSDTVIVVEDEDLKEIVEVVNVDETTLPSEEITLIVEKTKDKYTVVGYYDINLYKGLDENTKVEQLTESTDKVKVTLDIPTTIDELKDGYERTYYVIRVHNGKTEVLETVLSKDGKSLTFETDKFSTYSLTYVDSKNEVKNPQTADNIMIYAIIGLISLAGIVVTFKKLSKN